MKQEIYDLLSHINGSFDQIATVTFRHEKIESLRHLDIDSELVCGANWRDLLRGHRMAVRRTAQRAAGQHADSNYSYLMFCTLINQPPIILKWEARR